MRDYKELATHFKNKGVANTSYWGLKLYDPLDDKEMDFLAIDVKYAYSEVGHVTVNLTSEAVIELPSLYKRTTEIDVVFVEEDDMSICKFLRSLALALKGGFSPSKEDLLVMQISHYKHLEVVKTDFVTSISTALNPAITDTFLVYPKGIIGYNGDNEHQILNFSCSFIVYGRSSV